MNAVSGRRAQGLLLVVSLGAFLAAAEVLLRLAGFGVVRSAGYAPVNTNLKANRRENSRGYRDFERSLERSPGARRLLSLGDSFAWGVGVELEDAYPLRLERALTRRRAERWEVVNLAKPGMNTVDHLALLEKEGLDYAPDAVLLGYVLNDSEDAGSAEVRRAVEWAAPRYAPALLWDRSALYRFVGTRLWATSQNRRRVAGFRSMYADEAPGWRAGRQALRDMGALCRERGIPLLVAIFPLLGNPLDERYPFSDIHARVAQAAAEAGAKTVDLLPAFRGLRWELLVVDGAGDEHPNEIGHRIAARALLRALEDVVPDSARAPAQ
jgi:lysophospholipase L1-like esterase